MFSPASARKFEMISGVIGLNLQVFYKVPVMPENTVSYVAGDMPQKRFQENSDNAEYTTATHFSKRLEPMSSLGQEICSSNGSLKTVDSEEHDFEAFSPRLSYHSTSNVMLRPSRMSIPHNDRRFILPRTFQTDERLLHNILAYNPNERRPTFEVERPDIQDQIIGDFQHIGRMIWRLICEYSLICNDLSSRYDAVNAIQNYLNRHINTTILPSIHKNSSFEIKVTALATLTTIIFSTLSNERSVNRINGLLHAKVSDLIGDTMAKVVDHMTEDDIWQFLQEKERYQRMKDLQKLVHKLRWPIDGLEDVMHYFLRWNTRIRQGKLRRTLRYSFHLFQKGC